MTQIAETPQPPYYAAIFTAKTTDDLEGYEDRLMRMLELASKIPGYLGVEAAEASGFGIAISYWKDLESIDTWRKDAEHVETKKMGKEKYYESYEVRIARVETVYGFKK